MPAIVQTSTQDNVRVIGFARDAFIDASNVEEIARALYTVVETERSSAVLDFENVEFISSQALGVLVTLGLKAAKVGVKVVLARVRPQFMDIFALTNLDKMFEVAATVDEAVERVHALAGADFPP